MTPRQAQFVREYLIDLNGTQAAIRAGYSAKTATSAAERLLRNVDVLRAVQEAGAARAERTQINADWVLTRLDQESTADLADLYTESGALKSVHDWPLIWRQGLVAGIEAVEEKDDRGNVIGMVQKVKLSDRIKRIELIGKHVNVQAFRDQVAQSGTLTLTIAPEDAAL